jgi:hypothetical protein
MKYSSSLHMTISDKPGAKNSPVVVAKLIQEATENDRAVIRYLNRRNVANL